MFQDTLMIIKPDYFKKRKILLWYLLRQGFFIKGQRKTNFTPELAAEFYQDRAEACKFMFQVILLSKGVSETFVLSKEHAVKELKDVMVSHFGSLSEMEENIHVTQCQNKVQKEISFVFPNYIHEPILFLDQNEFCSKNSLVETTVNTLYDIVTNPDKDAHKTWKEQLCEAIILANRTLPCITNPCSHNLDFNKQDISQQRDISCSNVEAKDDKAFGKTLSFDCSSLNLTTSSCVSCSGFDSEAVRLQRPLEEIIKARTISLDGARQPSASTLNADEEHILEQFYVEEQVASDELFNHSDEKKEYQDILNINTVNQIDIALENEKNLKMNPPFDELINSEVPTPVHDSFLDQNSIKLLNEESSASVENVFPAGDENKEINFEEEAEEE